MGVVVLRGNRPTTRDSCSIRVIVLKCRCPKGVVALVGNWQRGCCPMGVIVLRGSCPWGSCPRGSCLQGSCPMGSCPRGSCPTTHLYT